MTRLSFANSKSLLASAVLLAGIASPALAGVEIELAGGLSTQTLESDDDDQGDIKLESTDISVYMGYRFKNFFSLGLIAAQKNYDLEKVAEAYAAEADPLNAESSGSLKGLIYGPQITIAYPWRYFQPYLRASYQVGTLKSAINYQSSGSSGPVDFAYETDVTRDFKSSVTQYSIGFRIPIAMAYFFVDYGVEQLHYTIDATEVKSRAVMGSDVIEDSETSHEKVKDSMSGTVAKVGLGFQF